MSARRLADQAALVCAVALSRFLFRSRLLYDVDSVNFALALERFDPQVHQPHPPGYYLYVCAGRLVYHFVHEANAALVLLSIIASCGTAVMIYALADAWFGRKAAIFAGALFLVSPLAWFHGTVALVYIVEAYFSALIGFLCWRMYRSESVYAIPSAVALGIAAGFRPSSMLLLGPLWLLSAWRLSRNKLMFSFGALGVTVLAWFGPMLAECGGMRAYLGPLTDLWNLVPGRQSIFQAGFYLFLARLCTAAAMYSLCFGAAVLLVFGRSSIAFVDRSKRTFMLAWILPGFLFFTLFFFKYVNSGYLLVIAPPGFAWLGARLAGWNSSKNRLANGALLGAGAAANIALFLFAPIYCSHRSVREFERELVQVRTTLARTFDARDTIIVGLDSHFLGYRHAAYYLPAFLTVQFPEVPLHNGRRVFAVRQRETVLLSELPATGFKRFVFFPLPAGAEYQAYFAGVRGRIPDRLQTIEVDGREFVTGPIAELQFLFPVSGGAIAAVYPTLHTAALGVNRWRHHQTSGSLWRAVSPCFRP